MAWYNPFTWGQVKRDERAIVQQLLVLLDSEEKEVIKMKQILMQMASAPTQEVKAQYFAQFQREFRKFEEAESIIKSLDEKTLARTVFNKLTV